MEVASAKMDSRLLGNDKARVIPTKEGIQDEERREKIKSLTSSRDATFSSAKM